MFTKASSWCQPQHSMPDSSHYNTYKASKISLLYSPKSYEYNDIKELKKTKKIFCLPGNHRQPHPAHCPSEPPQAASQNSFLGCRLARSWRPLHHRRWLIAELSWKLMITISLSHLIWFFFFFLSSSQLIVLSRGTRLILSIRYESYPVQGIIKTTDGTSSQ